MSIPNGDPLDSSEVSSSTFNSEVGACIPVMSVVSRQLTDVSQIVETGVVSACSRFAPMTRQIKELNLPAVRNKVESLSQLMHEQSQLNTQLLSMLKVQMAKRMVASGACIETTAEQSHPELDTVYKALEAAGHLAQEMQRINESVDEHLHAAMQLTESLHGQILGCVSDMQFQDAISQRLEHLVHVLRGMSQAVCERLSMTEPPAGSDPNPWLEMLAGSYTMDSERQFHVQADAGQTSQPNSGQTNPDTTSDVELF
jgi:hypothetical protein